MSRPLLPNPRVFCAWLCLLVCCAGAAVDNKDADDTTDTKKKPKAVAK